MQCIHLSIYLILFCLSISLSLYIYIYVYHEVVELMIELTMAIFQPHLGQVGAFSSNVLKSPGRQGLEPRFMGLAPHLW
jgi:hypothetical protein